MKNKIIIIISWLIALWNTKIFLTSLFYKFDNTALEPKYIFNTIGHNG